MDNNLTREPDDLEPLISEIDASSSLITNTLIAPLVEPPSSQ